MSQYIDIIFLLVIVGVVFYRLFSVFGTEPEKEKKIVLISKDDLKKANLNLPKEITDQLNLIAKMAEEEESEVCKTLHKIPNFNKHDFCTKAAKAFEMVLTAFACQDEKTLKMLTEKKLFTKFKKIIEARKTEGICAETDLIKIENVTIESADIKNDGLVSIVVKFVSEQINLLKNAAGEIIEGDENFVQKITDIWTFEKNINSPSKTWLLVSTKKN